MESSRKFSAPAGEDPVVLHGAAARAYRILERLVAVREDVSLFFTDEMPEVFADPGKNHVLKDIQGAIVSMEAYLDICVCNQVNPEDGN